MPEYMVGLDADEIEVLILGLERARENRLMAPARDRAMDEALRKLYQSWNRAKLDVRDGYVRS